MSTEKKYIDVDEAFEVITDFAGQAETKSAYGAYWKAAKAIKNLPSVSVSPVREGKWLLEREPDGKPYCLHCSVCDDDFSYIGIKTAWAYCPLCGAKMSQ